MKFIYQFNNETLTVELSKTSHGYRAVVNGQEYSVSLIRADNGELVYRVGEDVKRAYSASDGQRRWVFLDGKTFLLTSNVYGQRRKSGPVSRDHSAEKTIRAPMPGNVRAVEISEGDIVVKGQTLVVLEAMKMEIRIQAPINGKLARLVVRVGDQVERDSVLGEMA